MRSILLLQSAPIDLTVRVARRLPEVFPDCTVDLVVREDDRAAASAADAASVTVVRWEDRLDVIRQLRRRRYDAVVVPASHNGSGYLRALPLLLRTRAVLVFNEGLDWFPLHATRLGALAHHVSGEPSVGALVLAMARAAVLWPATVAVLLVAAARITARGALRRRRRRIRAVPQP